MFTPESQRLCRAACAAAAFIVFGAASAMPLLAQTPPLGDVARKEQERRKALPSSAKVYTNKDLPKGVTRPADGEAAQPAEPSSAIPAEGSAAAPAVPEPKAAASKDAPKGKPGNDEDAWRKRVTDAREEVRRNEMFAQALQTRINSVSRDMLSRDDPAQRARMSAERKEALAELDRVKQAIEAGKKQIADIEEEARKAGVPPGWLR